MNVASTEMDKSRDVRRGMTRFSRQQINTNKKQQQSRPNILFGGVTGVGDFVSLEKVKKEKIRRLSSVSGHRESPGPGSDSSNPHCETEMGSSCCCYLSSDSRENQCPSHSQLSSSPITISATNIFKIPKKLCYDCNVVNHVSVPRKLRSAMKKPSRESISPPLPDSKRTNHTLGGVEVHRKDDLKINLKQGESEWSRKPMVSGPITKDEEEVVETLYALAGMFPDGDSMDMNGERIEVNALDPPETVAAIKVKKEETNKVAIHKQRRLFLHSPSTLEDSTNDAAKLNTINEITSQDQHDLPDSRNSHFEPDSSLFQMRPSGRKAEMAFGVTTAESQMAQQHIIEEPRKKGLALWQNLVLDSFAPGSSKTCSLENGSSTEKVSKVTMDRKSTKRCATHVYISCLIRNFQMHNKEGILQQPLQLKPSTGLKQTALLYPEDSDNLRNAINGNIPSSCSGNSATNRNDYAARNSILQPKMVYQEQPQVASASGRNTSNKQTFDFLSLSTGGISIEVNNNSIKEGNAIESLSQLQGKVPYLDSFHHHHSLVPFSIPAPCYTDHLSMETATKQVQPQLPQYGSNPFSSPTYASHSGVTKQQQRLCAAHLAAQYKHGGTSTVSTQFPSWQNGKPEHSTSMPYAQNAIPPFSSLDVVTPKYSVVPQHQLLKIAISSSLPPTIVKRSPPSSIHIQRKHW